MLPLYILKTLYIVSLRNTAWPILFSSQPLRLFTRECATWVDFLLFSQRGLRAFLYKQIYHSNYNNKKKYTAEKTIEKVSYAGHSKIRYVL